MSSDYSILAPIYDRIGLSEYALRVTPRVINYAQVNDWLGRRVLDLGCGTGGATLWFTGHGYFAYSLDNTPEMLDELRASLGTMAPNANVIEGDLLALDQVENVDGIDMAFSLGAMNTLDSLRDLETAFKGVSGVIASGKFFTFDMHTIEGLTNSGQKSDEMIYDQRDLVVFRRNTYDYDRQISTQTYHVFREIAGSWERSQATIRRRAYPIQAVATLLRRQGFELVGLVDEDMNTVDLASPRVSRVIYVSKKL